MNDLFNLNHLLKLRNLNKFFNYSIHNFFNLYKYIPLNLNFKWPVLENKYLNFSFNLTNNFSYDFFLYDFLNNLWNLNDFLYNTRNHNNFLNYPFDFYNFWNFNHFFDKFFNLNSNFFNSIYDSWNLNNFFLYILERFWDLDKVIDNFFNLNYLWFSNNEWVS